MSELDPEDSARQCAQRHGNRPEALLEILHDLQEQLGHVPDSTVPALARALNLSRADVHGVISFYHDFRRQPGGRHTLRLCRAEACQSLGCESLVTYAEQRTGIQCGETSADGSVTLETVYCLGNCALGPAAMLDERLVGRLDRSRLDALLDRCQGNNP
jgi:formate dehydrogenase subunit gamma